MAESTTNVLQVGRLHPSLEQAVATKYAAGRLPGPPEEAARYLAESGESVVAVVTSGGTGIGADLMAKLPSLGAIINVGVGYDAIDIGAARGRGIAVSNTPDVLSDCVADLAVGGLIDVVRRLSAADRYVRYGSWLESNFPLTTKVSGKHVGIVGLGRIGRVIARRLEGFDMTISYHNRRVVPDVAYTYAGSVEELAHRCDVLIVAAAGGAGTRGLVSADVLDALGPHGYFVNVSRGSVVDQPALVSALVDGRIAGAALDVFEDEPQVPHELTQLDTVVLLPHVGSATHETREAMADLALRNLDQYMTDGSLVTPV